MSGIHGPTYLNILITTLMIIIACVFTSITRRSVSSFGEAPLHPQAISQAPPTLVLMETPQLLPEGAGGLLGLSTDFLSEVFGATFLSSIIRVEKVP